MKKNTVPASEISGQQDNSFTLWFCGGEEVELIQTEFHCPQFNIHSLCMRGAPRRDFDQAGCFHWSQGLKALCVLLLKNAVWHRQRLSAEQRFSQSMGLVPFLEGGKGSLAASLDYALAKQPCWLQMIFGKDAQGKPLAKKLTQRINTERKHAGPVLVFLNQKFLKPDNIKIFLNGIELQKVKAVEQIAAVLQRTDL